MFEKLKDIIAEQLSVDASDIELTTNFKDDLGADSLDLYELVMALEEEYNCEIPSDDLATIATVEDVIKQLKELGVEE
ncbi:MAG: acyl carrier protein [Lachnospiraceae bacterium]|nr:acyl carrier protein [Lachnospiraceae bacterium]